MPIIEQLMSFSILISNIVFLFQVQDPTYLEQQTQKPQTSRGRARFTQTSEFSDFVQSTDDPSNVRKPSRRRLDYERNLQPRFEETTANRRTAIAYEVSESIDDIPRNDFSRQRPRVITETSFELKNIIKKEPVHEVSSTTLHSTSAKLDKEETPSTAAVETTFSSESIISDLSSTEIISTSEPQKIAKAEPTKIDILPTEEPRRKLPRAQLRSRANTRVEDPTTTTTIRSRTRPNRRQPTTTTTTTTAAPESRRNFRRRPESRATLAIEKEHEHPTRQRPGRRTDTVRSNRRSDSEEDLEVKEIGRRRNLHTAQSRRSETKVSTESPDINRASRNRGRGSVRANTRHNIENTEETPLSTTFGSRSRSSRNRYQPIFDETKLEVLPLFESENKTEKITAVDNIPDISTSKIPDSTSPLSASTENTIPGEITKIDSTTYIPNDKINRRFPSRTKEIKNNRLEESRRNSRRRTSTTTEAPKVTKQNTRTNFRSRNRNEPKETTTKQTFRSRNSENTHEKRTFERVKPKRVEPTLSENRLQTLTPKRPSRRRDPLTTSTDATTTTHRGRIGSRFNEKEDLAIEEGAESNIAKSIEKMSDDVLLKHSQNAKRGSDKDHPSAEDSVEESDNYPEAFKAILQAKAKLKVGFWRSLFQKNYNSFI